MIDFNESLQISKNVWRASLKKIKQLPHIFFILILFSVAIGLIPALLSSPAYNYKLQTLLIWALSTSPRLTLTIGIILLPLLFILSSVTRDIIFSALSIFLKNNEKDKTTKVGAAFCQLKQKSLYILLLSALISLGTLACYRLGILAIAVYCTLTFPMIYIAATQNTNLSENISTCINYVKKYWMTIILTNLPGIAIQMLATAPALLFALMSSHKIVIALFAIVFVLTFTCIWTIQATLLNTIYELESGSLRLSKQEAFNP